VTTQLNEKNLCEIVMSKQINGIASLLLTSVTFSEHVLVYIALKKMKVCWKVCLHDIFNTFLG